ncbi:MAG: replication-associated recombination protein A, partial [Oscillospiraceae bacterium]|nr:replication-associated recombination protein A [Oscillospiraceae bacterium]
MDVTAPLAHRMKPETLDQFVGQEAILGQGKALRRMILSGKVSSIILSGPPGTGKTSLAKVIAGRSSLRLIKLNAVTSGVADIKEAIAEAQNRMLTPEGRLLLFIDEIHRFNKAQQDALLPSVEDGTIVLVGATTENPFFEVNKALISRSSVFILEPLRTGDVLRILRMAVEDGVRGLGGMDLDIGEGVLEFMAERSGGDSRVALNALELAVATGVMGAGGSIKVDMAAAADCMQKKVLPYDKSGDSHYDNISAFIKSMRGSDPDAAVFYLARALHSGESPEFLARRIVICASEDVGMANPSAIQVAV